MDDDEPTEVGNTRRSTVLIVDDLVPLAMVLRRVLHEHEVTVVTRAEDALDLLASGRSFDVILSDLMMPRMTGMDLYDQLSRDFPWAAERMIFMTGTAFTPAAHAFFDRVANERLEKPFALGAVRAAVAKTAARTISRNSFRADANSSAEPDTP
jgi:CheY-like chemotaxis protein